MMPGRLTERWDAGYGKGVHRGALLPSFLILSQKGDLA